jgi:hypothetical protein
VSFVEPEVEPSALPRVLLVAGMAVSAVVRRWRAIILWHILVLTVWLAFQMFFLARGAILYLEDNLPKLSEPYRQLPSIHIPSAKSLTVSPPITNCWRDRSLAGNCFNSERPGRQPPPVRFRAPEPSPPPCHRFRSCRPVDI